ncbi:hypothetical protein K456DRAFT_845375 [Colletotrichum gloeosporioides 23]|nr:hypothetical protein K456DRAFT_845375 [Colletotrichum gloeosporioides 23]
MRQRLHPLDLILYILPITPAPFLFIYPNVDRPQSFVLLCVQLWPQFTTVNPTASLRVFDCPVWSDEGICS